MPSRTCLQIIKGAFTILSEVYHTDIPLTFAPSIIAATCLNMSASMKRVKIETVLSTAVGLDWEEVAAASEELVGYFEKHTSQNKSLLFINDKRANEYLRKLKDAYQRKLQAGKAPRRYMHMCIYIYREREREREGNVRVRALSEFDDYTVF